MMKRRGFLAVIGLAIASLLLTISLPLLVPFNATAQSSTTLLVSAAASLKDVLEESKNVYQQRQPGVNINFNFGASGALLQQIQQGAPADIFISAANRQVDALQQGGQLVAGTRSVLAKNRLVLVVPRRSTGITSFFSLTNSNVRRIAMGEPRSVPAGQYAEQVLQKLKIYDKVKSKLVFANNVRQVLAAVEAGNADAGLVYRTDATISNRVRTVVAADEKYHNPIVYPAAVLKRSKSADAARAYLQFLTSDQGKAIFKKYGFLLS